MYRKLNCCLILLAYLLTVTTLAHGYGNNSYTDEEITAFTSAELNNVTSSIPSTHPRIFLKASELEALKARVGIGNPSDYNLSTLKWRGKSITFGEMSSEYQTLKNMAETYKNDPEGMWDAVDNNNDIKDVGWTAAAYAFVNLIEPDNAYVASAKYILDVAVNNPQTSQGSAGGKQAWTFAIAYDWLANDLLSSEKNTYITYMLDQVEIFGFVGGSGGHFPKLYDLSNLNSATGLRSLFVGLAIYNDETGAGDINSNNAESKNIIKDYGGFFKRVVEGFKMAGGTTGGYYEDFGHAGMALDNLLVEVELWYQATGENLFQNFNTLHYRPLLNYGVAKPNRDAVLSSPIKFDNYRMRAEYELIANRFQDSTIQTMAKRDFGLRSNGHLWKEILWKDNTLNDNVDLDNTLPRAIQFNPTGWMFIRSGWNIGSRTNPSDEFWTSIFSGRSFSAHKWYMMNSFGIYYKGGLLLNNEQDGPGKPTKYHNTIMLDNDNQREERGPIGGPEDIIGWKNYQAGTKADLSRFTRFETTNSYTYTLSESHEIYSTSKLDYWTREFVYLNPSQTKHYFIVYDRMTTDSSSTVKKNMLNSYNQPQVNGDIIRVDVDGSSADNMDGRAFINVLLPDNNGITIEQISGNESEGQNKARPRYGILITPSIQARDDKFLNVIQATDSSISSMTATSRIDANTMTGALINDATNPQIVLFSSDNQGANVNTVTYQANYSSSLSGKHLLLDISPGTYDVYKNGIKIQSNINASYQGVLSFNSSGGSLFQVVQTGVAPTQDPTPPTIPNNLAATTMSSSQINLSWNASTDDVGVLGYKIYRDGTQITTTINTTYSDTGLSSSTTYTYKVSAYDATGNESVQSNQTTATTSSEFDTTPPTITTVSAGGVSTQIVVVFSEPVEQASAENTANYNINSGIIVSGASLGSDLKTVTLTTSTHTDGVSYTLTVNNIKDRAIVPNTIAANSQMTYTFIVQLVSSNITVTSGQTYEIVQNGLQDGVLVYIDRTYTYSGVPVLVEGATYIKTANDDKLSGGSSFITFDVNQDVTVYVAHDDRIIAKPSWMTSFTDTGDDLVIVSQAHSIWKKDFTAGTITLGGNAGGGNGSMYSIIIVEQGTGSAPDTTPPYPPSGLFFIPWYYY